MRRQGCIQGFRLLLPPHSAAHLVDEMAEQAKKIALALGVRGLMNIQFAVTQDGAIYVLEVNPVPPAPCRLWPRPAMCPLQIAARVMAGEALSAFNLGEQFEHVCVKEAVFPFDRFPGFDPVLGLKCAPRGGDGP